MADSTNPDERLLQFSHPTSDLAVVLEDDGRVAYAYLTQSGKVVADVWLYNVGPTPDVVDWRNPAEMPFLNPKDYCKAEDVVRLSNGSEVVLGWSDVGVEICLDGVVMARLEIGSRPGWSRLALRPGPLARPL